MKKGLKAYLLTDAQARLLSEAGEHYLDSVLGLRVSEKAALEQGRTALTQPLSDIARQAHHEWARRYAND